MIGIEFKNNHGNETEEICNSNGLIVKAFKALFNENEKKSH